MGRHVVALAERAGRVAVDGESILNALSSAVVVIGPDGAIVYVNAAGEHLFACSASSLEGHGLDEFLPAGSPLFTLIEQVLRDGGAVSEYGAILQTPRIGRHFVNVHAAPLPELPDLVVVAMHPRSIADAIERQLTHRAAARSVSGMAAMLAHEVKNPLSGIRGAAQLLERGAAPEDRALAELIRDEADRICALVDRMEVFSVGAPPQRSAVNIHQVLDRVHQLARTGFARHVRFVEDYDPSLPPVLADHDQLVQVFLNLVKNAAEAVPAEGGEVVLSTAYRRGVSLAVGGASPRVHLPLMVGIQDNGAGIPEDIQASLFDPFVTSKPKGSGLGLALVAKIVGDHGGVIEFDTQARRTVFRVMLPVCSGPDDGKAD